MGGEFLATDLPAAAECLIGLDEAEGLFHLSFVVNIFGKDIFVDRVSRRAMHVEVSVAADRSGQLAQKVPPPRVVVGIADGTFQLVARPEDCPLGSCVEALGVEQSALIVIAQQGGLALHYQIEAFARIGPIADDIAQAVNLADRLTFDVGQHRLETFQVAVYVADDCS